MTDDELWRKRFQLFAAMRLIGLMFVMLGIAIAFTDLVRPGGWKLVGGLLAITGVIDAVYAPRVLKRAWERQEK
jgi:membrane protein implicated in regulation of membrane protease activity